MSGGCSGVLGKILGVDWVGVLGSAGSLEKRLFSPVMAECIAGAFHLAVQMIGKSGWSLVMSWISDQPRFGLGCTL